jgi:hypothetical protein
MKLKNIFIGLGCVLAFSSCTNEMDYHEYTVYGKDYVFTDFGRTSGFVTNIYSYLDSDLPSSGSLSSACDESEYAWSWSNIHDFYNGSWGPLNSYSMWGYYRAIREANYYLKEFPNADFSELKFDKDYQAQMNRFNRYQYEVRLLRAYYYFLLVRAYGDVPFTTNVLTEDEANKLERTPATTVFQFITDECDSVADKLPINYNDLKEDASTIGSVETGRVTRGMALALKARTLLYQASPLFNANNDLALWKKAAEASKAVIDYCSLNKIKLGKYSALWGTENWKASEMIFVRRLGDTNSPETTNFPVGMENGNSGNCPTQTLVDAYEMKTTGKAWDETESGYDPQKPYTNRDPRLSMTVAVNGEKWPNTNANLLEIYIGGRNGLPISGATPTGYYLKKYLDGTIDISAQNSSGGKRHNWITFRLGEFYLNYAEAVFKYLGSADATNEQFTMSAKDAVNVIRNREDVKMPAFPAGLSNADFWKKYERERMVELAFEGHRFWDVRRWKEGDKFKSIVRMEISKDNSNYTYNRVIKNRIWDDKMYLFPIPDVEIRKNPNLTQNPGW